MTPSVPLHYSNRVSHFCERSSNSAGFPSENDSEIHHRVILPMASTPNESVRMIGEYIVHDLIGQGTTSRVWQAQHSQTGQQVAIKVIKKAIFETNATLRDKIQREIALMRLFDHPHILKLVEVCESARHLYVVLEYASNGELFNFLVSQRHLGFGLAMKFFRQLIYGLDYLHSHAICHRDLKPENILLDAHFDLKIADFGFARWMKASVTETACGSPHYAAPEVIRGGPYDGRIADIWSAGVILYALLCGSLPFVDPAIRTLLAKVKSGQYVMPDLPRELQDLISRMLVVDPAKRIKIEEIKAHPGFRWELPDQYVLPTPLPTPVRMDPVDPASVSQEIRNALRQIGFVDDEELINELTSTGYTMAKVFYRMLTANTALDALPWFVTHENAAQMQDMCMVTPASGSTNPIELNVVSSYGYGASFSERVPLPSIPTQQSWCDVVQPFYGITCPWEVLLMNMQEFLTAHDFEWFHCDDYTLVSRRHEDLMYLIIKLERDAEEKITMKVFFADAPQEAVQIMLECITMKLTQIVQ